MFRIGIDEAIAGGISDARNSRLFNMFSLIEVGERSGSGLCNIFHTWNENGYKRPSITETLDPDRITITLQIEIDSNGSNHERNDSKSESNERNHESNLSENEMRVFEVLCRNNGLSAGQVAAQTGLSVSTVNRIYKSLKAKSYIMRNGKTRGKWVILK